MKQESSCQAGRFCFGIGELTYSVYKSAFKDLEKKYQLSTQAFLKSFESGQLGDDADYFDWHAFAKLLARWQKAQSAIHSAIQ